MGCVPHVDRDDDRRRGADGRSAAIRRAVIAVAVVVVAAGCARAAIDQTTRSAGGAIIEAGALGTEHLRVGDCLRDPLPPEVGALFAVPCARSHAAQVFAVVEDSSRCFDAVDPIIGRLLDRDDLPQIDVSALVADDGPHVVCVFEFADAIEEDLVRAAG